jgi:hypothetical protein
LFDYCEGARDFVPYCGEVDSQQRFLWVDDDVGRNRFSRQRHSNRFAKAALHTIALNRTAERAAHGESYAQAGWRRR